MKCKRVRVSLLVAMVYGLGGWGAAMAGACTPVPPNLISWWRANENTLDNVGPNDGIPVGNVAYTSGVNGRAFVFDGGTSYVAVPTSNGQFSLADRSFTIDAWVNFSSVGYRSPFVAHDDGPGNQRKWIFWYDALGDNAPGGPALRFHLNGPDLGAQDPIWVAWTPVAGKSYHVAVTSGLVGNNNLLSGSSNPTRNYALYINGVQVQTASAPFVIEDAAYVPLTIGQAEGYFTAAAMDEIDIFDRALGADEIAAIYNARIAGKCVPGPASLSSVLTGVVPSGGKATCSNGSTGQNITITLAPGQREVDCLAAGLVANPGDNIQVTSKISGVAQ